MEGPMEALLLFLAVLSPVALTAGIAIKFYKISQMPLNIRWEIYPLPKGELEKIRYGGSYMEEIDWVKKNNPRRSYFEFVEPFKELFFLHRVHKFNKYGLWIWSMALHWAVGLLFGTLIILLLDGIFTDIDLSGLVIVPIFSYVLGVFGSLGLIAKRFINKELKLYTSGIEYFNLIFLLLIFFTGFLSFIQDSSLSEAFIYVDGVLKLSIPFDEISSLTIIHFLLVELFLMYIPFSKFFHGPVKFFTFHKILWSDEFQTKGSKEEKKIMQQLHYKVRWSGPHMLSDQNWLENAKNTNLHEKS
jgi:nitrate reductase gamma subunit